MSHNKPSRLRFAINLGNAVLAHLGETGKPAGITVELSHRLATRWGVSAEFVPYPAAGKVVADAGGEHWDIAFLAIDPAREATLRFTSPYITIQGTALVSVDSPCQSVADMDRPATTINVGQNAAYDLWLTRHLQHASLHRLPSSQEAIDAFLAGEGDMVAGIRQPLEATARQHAGVRVLADNFTEIQQAICVARADVDRFHAVNDALSEWRADGSLLALIAGHRAKRTESRLRHPAHGAMPAPLRTEARSTRATPCTIRRVVRRCSGVSDNPSISCAHSGKRSIPAFIITRPTGWLIRPGRRVESST